MFSFLKDMSLASHGVDIEAVNLQRDQERELKRQGRYIFSVRAKVTVCVLAALYIAVTVYSMTGRSGIALDSVLDALFIASALCIGICLWAFGKKGEVISLCGIAVLLIGLYIRVLM